SRGRARHGDSQIVTRCLGTITHSGLALVTVGDVPRELAQTPGETVRTRFTRRRTLARSMSRHRTPHGEVEDSTPRQQQEENGREGAHQQPLALPAATRAVFTGPLPRPRCAAGASDTGRGVVREAGCGGSRWRITRPSGGPRWWCRRTYRCNTAHCGSAGVAQRGRSLCCARRGRTIRGL